MRVILKEDFVQVPDGKCYTTQKWFWLIVGLTDVKVSIKSRIVTVKGPRGEITKPFNHKAIDIKILDTIALKKKGKYVRLRMWNASYKQAAAVTTFKTLISHMITGVTEVSIYKSKIALITP